MIELIKPLVELYPGWTLVCLFLPAASAIAAVPATAKALRGTPSRKSSSK